MPTPFMQMQMDNLQKNKRQQYPVQIFLQQLIANLCHMDHKFPAFMEPGDK
jgi:hypothetical protein